MSQEPQTDPVPTPTLRLFRHSKRPQWGVAALVWERNEKRGYQFSDGKMRVFKEGFYGLFESAVAPGDGSAKAVLRLARLAQSEDVTEATRLPTLRDQIGLFRALYPEGFAGERWQAKHRNNKSRKRLKRHRDAALADADKLALAPLDAMIADADWVGIHTALVEVLAGTDLVPTPQRRKLEKLAPSRSLALALRTWLHAEGEAADKERHFNAFVRELGDAAGWQLATSVAALVHPTQHTCVRTSAFLLQGKMLLSKFSIPRRPNARDYRRLRHVAETVRRELEEAGLPPGDLLDVYDFIWLTLRPAAREDLLAVPLARAQQAEAEAEAKAASDSAEGDVKAPSDSADDVSEAA